MHEGGVTSLTLFASGGLAGIIVSQMVASRSRHKVRVVSSTPAFYTAVKSSL